MDTDYEVDDEYALSPEDQAKVRIFGRLATVLIVTAWVSTGLFIGATIITTIMACIGYWRRHFLRRRVQDMYKNSVSIGLKISAMNTTTAVSDLTNIKQS